MSDAEGGATRKTRPLLGGAKAVGGWLDEIVAALAL
jgi:hypothetical protein